MRKWVGCAIGGCGSNVRLGYYENWDEFDDLGYMRHPCPRYCTSRTSALLDCNYCAHAEKRGEWYQKKDKKDKPQTGWYCLKHNRPIEAHCWEHKGKIESHGTEVCDLFEPTKVIRVAVESVAELAEAF